MQDGPCAQTWRLRWRARLADAGRAEVGRAYAVEQRRDLKMARTAARTGALMKRSVCRRRRVRWGGQVDWQGGMWLRVNVRPAPLVRL